MINEVLFWSIILLLFGIIIGLAAGYWLSIADFKKASKPESAKGKNPFTLFE